jgi:transcriptional regulator with XRE-family HTH domain
MSQKHSVTVLMSNRGLDTKALVEATGLERRVVEAIVQGRWTPSPQQRQRLAAALGVTPDDIAWGHTNEVAHIQGHGPQFGRSP